MATTDAETIRLQVKEHYGAAARQVSGCCGSRTGHSVLDPDGAFGAGQYDDGQLAALPAAATAASLGCGNPTMLATMEPGQTVLDLGSGGGIDVILSARRVGADGFVYGLDMTPDMIQLARRNLAEAGVQNAEILEGHLEDIPLPGAAVDVIISNCVINLSPDKRRSLSEAFRVLRPGGLFAVSDVVLSRPLPPVAQELLGLWAGCVAGALTADEYTRLLTEVGFVDIEVVPTIVHDRAAVAAFAASFDTSGITDPESLLDEMDGAVMNAFVRARRP
ncbi:MAG TPA: arsenite methyltransferase [Ilumatobacteraceae bacterium]|nr:arsenite methyltransferase [Ilumatobacteraceae bacterium]